MHSRIFQFDREKVDVDDYITPDNYYDNHWFVSSVADYVTDTPDREDDLKWIVSVLSSATDKFSYDDKKQTITFKKGFKKEYFKKKYEESNKCVGELTMDIFCGEVSKYDTDLLLYRLKESIEEKWTFYIEYEDYGLMTLDSFVRDNLLYDTEYYFAGTLDYHC